MIELYAGYTDGCEGDTKRMLSPGLSAANIASEFCQCVSRQSRTDPCFSQVHTEFMTIIAGGFIASLFPVTRRTAPRAGPLAVALWSMLELPIELILAQSSTERFASAAGRLIWIALAFGTIYEIRFARAIFLFLCGVSSIVVAQALPMTYELSPLVFSVLVVDFLLKVFALLYRWPLLRAAYSR